ncbi:MAG: HD domain-containing protein [Sedimentisphaerales bacterium]|nr:HD domain-containing protein [Sedimentisphaerales bacterium]
MEKVLSTTENSLAFQSCREVQEMLVGVGISSALLSPDGCCLNEIISGEEFAGCDCVSWPNCHLEHRDTKSRASENSPNDNLENITQELCPAGFIRMEAKIKHRRRQIGTLVLCFKNLSLESCEKLENVCSRLKIDSSWIVKRSLPDALSGESVTRALHTILEKLLSSTIDQHTNRAELDALSNSLAQSYEELSLLHRISDRMQITQQPQQFFGELCENLKDVAHAAKIAVLWADRENPDGVIHRICSTGLPDLDNSDWQLLWHRVRNQVLENGRILLDSNVDGPYTQEWPETIRNLIGLPIRRSDEFMGALIAVNKIDKADFDSIDIKLLSSVANESAVYLDNYYLYMDLQELLLGTLRALTNSIDAKDPYTSGHSERVAIISRWLAHRLQLNPLLISNIYLAGLLHDVGKIGVRETVLLKPGQLSKLEFEQIREHPEIGANILSGIKQMQEVTPIVLTHHERFDGLGYPRGLKNENIPLGGRIVMLADSFDAMVSNRTYRRALPATGALAEIRRCSGTQFDPKVTQVFLDSNIDQLLDLLNPNGPGNQNSNLPIMSASRH